MSGLTAEQKVKARWPDAYAPTPRNRRSEIHPYSGCYWGCGEDIGKGATEAEAWADAASRIESKPQTESAPEPDWKAEADRLAEALKLLRRDWNSYVYNIRCNALIQADEALASYAAKGGGK